MKRKKKIDHDPRLATPPGHFLRTSTWVPEMEGPTSFFSIRDTIVLASLVVACLIVATVLWLKPPKYISFDADESKVQDPGISAKNIPRQLQRYPGYDTKKFEEVPDDDPAITGDEEDLPIKDPVDRPRTLKSHLKKVMNYFLSSLRYRPIA